MDNGYSNYTAAMEGMLAIVTKINLVFIYSCENLLCSTLIIVALLIDANDWGQNLIAINGELVKEIMALPLNEILCKVFTTNTL